ncbi:site-specific integrase [Variovorax sp. J31P179]|uniref:tyrosine-type recombinase/integrase n=1 Tax=Variovorax sp. J31P179 TaxID=3053508 RepID=UPI0025771090|nr:site-specific integrase [Variovorax sp. J31P179]MDM0082351.1 site-specific integrase [Variovorax sp. J31P179]
MTIEAIKALAAGEKLALGESRYARRNSDGSWSFTLRKKVDGKAKDITLARVDTLTKGTLADIKGAASDARKAVPEVVEAPKPAKKGALASDATLGDVWAHFLSAVDRGGKWAERTRKTSVDRVTKYLEPSDLWGKPVARIDAADIAELLEPVRRDAPAQSDKVRGLLSLTFAYAQTHRLITVSPVQQAGAMLRATTKRAPKQNFPTFTKWDELRKLYATIQNSDLEASVRHSLMLQAMTMTRSGEAIGARWDEFDLDAGTWTVPRSRMKTKDASRGDHILHLSTHTVAWLAKLPRKGDFLFPGRSGNDTISLDAPAKAMRSTLGMGGQFVPHSWRSACSTLAKRAVGEDGRPLFHRAWVETLLDHEIGENEVEGAYDRGSHHEEAGKVLEWWCGQLLA